MENKGVRFIAQQVMDGVLDYAKVSVMIQYFPKCQSYAKAMGTPYDPKDTRCARRRDNTADN